MPPGALEPRVRKRWHGVRLHRMRSPKADDVVSSSFACSRFDSKASTGVARFRSRDLSSIPDQRGTNTKDPATHEKSVRVARRALSASLSWGKHRLAQEAGLFRDVLLHRSTVTEVLVFFQWYLFITVITHRYEPSAIRRQRFEFGRRVRASSKSRRVIRAKAIRLDGNVPIGMMPSGLANAAMAAVSSPMPWPKATLFLEHLVLVSVLFVIMNLALICAGI